MPFLKLILNRRARVGVRRWWSIIGTLLLVGAVSATLSGCGAVRLAYNNAPNLAYWWLDGYFDFDSAQSLRIRNDLDDVLVWHRKDELPLIAAQLANLKTRALQNATTEQTCKIYTDAQTRFSAGLERMVPTVAAVAPTLQEAQLQHIARAFEKSNATWREKYLDGTPAERNTRRAKQAIERAESFYGSLSAEQVAMVRAQVSASLYDPATHLREKQRRHQDALQVLTQLRSSQPTQAQAQVAIVELLQRTLSPPDPALRQYLAQVTQQGCTAMTALHNSMSPKQRAYLLATLQEYEDDVRQLSRSQ